MVCVRRHRDSELWRYLMAVVLCRPLATSGRPANVATATLHPNPATTYATAAAVPGTHRLHLLDATGRPLRTYPAAPGTETPVSVLGLPSGLYFLQWLTPAGQVLVTRRLVKE